MSQDRTKAYTQAGVDINAGNLLVERIAKMVKATRTPGVVADIGGFGGLFKPDLSGMEAPLLVGATDGVGTKLKLAFQFNRHHTIGIDLVAMSVNDVLVQGARPLFFLDYFATGKLDVDVAEQVISGIAEGCRQSACALLGGETAEMPDMYAPGEYDLAGFCVGLVDNDDAVDGSTVSVDDVLIGLSSSGAHSNGYSLIRKLFDASGLKGDDPFPGSDQSAAEVLLEPTYIYVEKIRNLMRDFPIKGMVHITGGGFYFNIPRVLPNGVTADIDFNAWPQLPVFNWIKDQGNLSWPEMLTIFNCGIGYILIVSPEHEADIHNRLRGLNQSAWTIGKVRRQTKSDKEQVFIKF